MCRSPMQARKILIVLCYLERESHGEDPVDCWGQDGRMQELWPKANMSIQSYLRQWQNTIKPQGQRGEYEMEQQALSWLI